MGRLSSAAPGRLWETGQFPAWVLTFGPRAGRAAATFPISAGCRIAGTGRRRPAFMSHGFRTVLSVVVVLGLLIWGQVFAGFGPVAQAGARAASAVSLADTPE